MKNYAVICEYNPFHFGHEYQISKIKENGGTVTCIMSGDFCQRGEAAAADKYARARMAVMGGADLVLELPFPYSAAGAEKFAFGGVDIMSRLGYIDALSFGSECGDAELIRRTAENTLSAEFARALSEALAENKNKPYGTVYFDTYARIFGEGVFGGSNNILGVAYASEIIKKGLATELTTVKRSGEEYNGGGAGFASASTVRSLIEKSGVASVSDMLPAYSLEILGKEEKERRLCRSEKLFPVFASFLRMSEAEDIARFAENDISLAPRLIKAGADARSIEELYSLAVTKKYSLSHVKRALLFAYFGVTDALLSERPAYTVLLAANETGRTLLSRAKKSAEIPIITKPANYEKYGDDVKKAFELAKKASAVRALAMDEAGRAGDMMRKTPTVI